MNRFLFCLLFFLPLIGYAGIPVEYNVNGVAFRMMPVAGGTFSMGATGQLEGNAESYEMPTHQVKLSDYMIGETEVTQRLWEAVMANELTGLNFRLPTEAEWEYAAKGGSNLMDISTRTLTPCFSRWRMVLLSLVEPSLGSQFRQARLQELLLGPASCFHPVALDREY